MTSVADIIGPEAAAGDPGSIHRQAAHLRDLAENASHVRGQLGSLTPSRWTGLSATAFHASRDQDLPTQLSRLVSLLVAGASALGSWATELDEIQHRARELARRKDEAVRAAQAAQARATAAQQKVKQATRQHLASAGDPIASVRSAAALASSKGASVAANAAAGGANRAVTVVDAQAFALRAELGVTASRRSRELNDAGDPLSITKILGIAGTIGAVAGLGARGLQPWMLGTGGGQRGHSLIRGFLDDGRVRTTFTYVDEAFKNGKRVASQLAKTTVGNVVDTGKRLGSGAQAKLYAAVRMADGRIGNFVRGGAKVLGPVGFAYSVYQTGSNVFGRVSRGDYGGAVVATIGGVVSLNPIIATADFVTGGFLGSDKGVVSGTTAMLADSFTDADAATQKAMEGGYGPGMQGIAHVGDAYAEVAYTGIESYHLVHDVLSGDGTAVDRAMDGQYGDGVRHISNAGDAIGGKLYDVGSSASNAVGQGVKSVQNVFRF